MSSTVKPKKTLSDIVFEFSIPLIAGVILAVLWANSTGETFNYTSYSTFINQELIPGFEFVGHKLTFKFLVNDIFMVFFFGIATVEILNSFQVGGPLNPVKKAINPLISSLGGVFGPIAVFFLLGLTIPLDNLTSEVTTGEILNGWGIPTATDIALAWLFARLIFGSAHPAISFLLLLAIVDDAIGLIIIAVFYPSPYVEVQPAFLLINVAAILVAYLLKKNKVEHLWVYLLFAGLPSWFGLILTHVHPALALVSILPFLPISKERNLAHEFEHRFKQPVDTGLLLFGIANAGVQFSAVNQITWMVFGSLMVGKSVGVFLFGVIAEKFFKFPLPEGINYRSLFVTGMIAGVGLTVALFVAGEAYTNPILQGPAKMGAILSVICVPAAFFLAKIFKIKKINNS